MVNMALWIKANRFKLDQVQNFYPSPLANATTMYYTEKNPLNKVSRQGGDVFVVKGERRRRLHKALLRYHDPAGWPMIREALLEMGKGHLIGNGPDCLVPPEGRGEAKAERSRNKGPETCLDPPQRHHPISVAMGLATKDARSEAGAAMPRRPANMAAQGGQWQTGGSQLQKGSVTASPSSQGTGQAQGKVNLPANPPTRGKAPTRASSAKPAPNLPLRVASLRQRQWCQATGSVIFPD